MHILKGLTDTVIVYTLWDIWYFNSCVMSTSEIAMPFSSFIYYFFFGKIQILSARLAMFQHSVVNWRYHAMCSIDSCPQQETVFGNVVESLGEGDLLRVVCQQKQVFRFYGLPPHLLSASSPLMEYSPQPLALATVPVPPGESVSIRTPTLIFLQISYYQI